MKIKKDKNLYKIYKKLDAKTRKTYDNRYSLSSIEKIIIVPM